MKNILALILLFLAYSQMNAQCIVTPNCQTGAQACDYTPNNALLWNETYWSDPANQTQDLSDTQIDLNFTATDTCAAANLTIRYLLFLDLDHNDSLETVIKSWEPPAPGTVNYNNWNNPNYDGGEVRNFDERPVPLNEKYQFALQTTVNGNTTKGYLRWNTQAASNTFIEPELPYATHKIKWLADDNLGNSRTCEYPFIVRDCIKPTVVCFNGLAVNIMVSGEVTLHAPDFLQYMTDNITPANLLETGIRKCGTGLGFPLNPDGSPQTSITYNCDELGTQCIELWARDAAGNADFCETYVIVQDNAGNCGGGNGNDDAPTIVCLNGLSVNITPNGQKVVSTTDFLHYAEDDNTPFNLLEFSIRKCNSDIDFPTDPNGDPIPNVVFSCDELGFQCVELWARDLDGNASYCTTYIDLQDNFGNCQGGGGNNTAPTVVCYNGLSVNIMVDGHIQVWAPDFLQYAEDDLTPSSLLQFGIRKAGDGVAFPVDSTGSPNQNVVFSCAELGTQQVELWVKDLDGNADYCQTYVYIQDNAGNCNGNIEEIEVTTCLANACNGAGVQDVNLLITGIALDNAGPVGANGCSIFPIPALVSGSFVIIPSLDANPVNGVTVLDLIKIKKYILGLEYNLTPYEMIAADANKSGTITGFDIIELRNLILGIKSGFPNNKSWRFIDAGFSFPNPQNPFQTFFPEVINASTGSQTSFQFNFKALKVGDLDCDAWPGLQAPSHDRGIPQRSLTLPDVTMLEGETTELALKMSEAGNWEGLQMSLQFDPEKLEMVEVLAGELPGLDADAFHQPKPGVFNFVWAGDQPQRISEGQDILLLRVRALAPLKISEVFKTAADFDNIGSLDAEAKALSLDFGQNDAPVSRGETAIFMPQPNPTTAGASIPVRLGQAERVQIEIADLSGKTLWTKELDLAAGAHLLDIEAGAMPQAGVYVWRVQTGNKSVSGKLVRI